MIGVGVGVFLAGGIDPGEPPLAGPEAPSGFVVTDMGGGWYRLQGDAITDFGDASLRGDGSGTEGVYQILGSEGWIEAEPYVPPAGEVTITSISAPTGGEAITTGDGDYYNLGTRFQVTAAATMVKARMYRPAADAARTLRVWSLDSTTPLAEVVAPANPGSDGWHDYAFASPPALTAGQSYVVGFTRQGAGADEVYYSRPSVFTAPITNGILTLPQSTGSDGASGNGLFIVADPSIATNRPNSSFNSSFYFVLPVVLET